MSKDLVRRARELAADWYLRHELRELAVKMADAIKTLTRERDAALKALELRQYQIDELRKSSPPPSTTVDEIIAFILAQDIHSWQPRILADRIRAEFGKEQRYCPGCDSELEPDGKCALCGVRWVEPPPRVGNRSRMPQDGRQPRRTPG